MGRGGPDSGTVTSTHNSWPGFSGSGPQNLPGGPGLLLASVGGADGRGGAGVEHTGGLPARYKVLAVVQVGSTVEEIGRGWEDSGRGMDAVPRIPASHFANCEACLLRITNIVTRKHLASAVARYPDAAKEVLGWRKIAATSRWRTFLEVRQTFVDADAVDAYVVFNVRGNRYRLVTVIHYSRYKDDRLTEGHIHNSIVPHAPRV